MKFPIAALAGAGALLCAGAALAQNAPQQGPYDQGPPQGYYQQMPPQQMPPQQMQAMHRHRGALEIIRDEIRAGRLSEKEGTLIARKIKEVRMERREERQARLNGQYGPPQQQQMPQQYR